jgi:hypothetical protein
VQPFVLHAHFYQPERLNPWTGALDPEPSAAPDRDWNQRILRECYRPNGFARIFDGQHRVEQIVNNYERLSFNFGPTLLAWMEQNDPETYAQVLDGDWRSAVRMGHGNALAQAYNHMILPLANERDRRTQIRWGLTDFTYRFGRRAEGLWLPETAADPATIDELIDAGVQFTVLAPHQAGRVRSPGGEWQDAAHLDTSRAYKLQHSDGSGRWLAVFFYDGGLAQSLAFDPAAADAGVLVERILGAGRGEGLVHAALDGETFGHHHAFGELGLAYALVEGARQRGLEPTNYATYLAQHPPHDEVELVPGEGTAWSCVHGVGRWYRDCGCATDSLPGWNQAWRTPLRAALDVVRDLAIEVFEAEGKGVLTHPWDARDDYIRVRLGEWTRTEFLDRHAARNLGDEQHRTLWTLLEAQRHAMVMYTSCGWFFSDVSGIETVYVMRSAARVLGLLAEVCPGVEVDRTRDAVLDVLAEARSNQPGVGTGADVWAGHVATAEVTPLRVAAHYSLVGLVRRAVRLPETSEAGGHEVTVRDQRSETRGRVGLTTLHLQLRSLHTDHELQYAVAAVHLGELDFYGTVAPHPGDRAYTDAAEAVWEAFPTAPVARLIHLVGTLFEGEEFGIEHALPEGRQQLVGTLFSELAERFRAEYARLYDDHRRVLEMLTAAGYELPRDLRAAAELTLTAELERELGQLAERAEQSREDPLAGVKRVLAHARDQGYQLDVSSLEEALRGGLNAAARRAASSLSARDVDEVERWLREAAELGVDVDLSRAQELAYAASMQARAGRLDQVRVPEIARLGGLLGLSSVAWLPGRHGVR